jgi:hypothetical protein
MGKKYPAMINVHSFANNYWLLSTLTPIKNRALPPGQIS